MIINTDPKGRTVGGRFTRRDLIEYEANDFPADSLFWKQAARGSADALAAVVGGERYATWADLVWPGETIQTFSWRSIAEMNEAAIRLAMSGQHDLTSLARAALAQHYGECGCVLPEQSCPVCRVSGAEMPY